MNGRCDDGLASRVERSFSRSFDTYDREADEQAWIAQRLISTLKDCGAPTRFGRVVEFGCGTGQLTGLLRDGFEIDELSLNDLSPQAAEIASTHGAGFFCGDAMAVNWPDTPDLVISASMIQWLQTPAYFIAKAVAALAPGGWLALSGFGPDQFTELAGLGSKAAAPGLCGTDELAAAMGAEMTIHAIAEQRRKLIFDTPIDVLRHLRRTGVNGRATTVWTRSRLGNWAAEYRARFGDGSGVCLTYHPVWVVAQKR